MLAGITFPVCRFIFRGSVCTVDGTSPGSVECVNIQEEVSFNLEPLHEYSVERGVSKRGEGVYQRLGTAVIQSM